MPCLAATQANSRDWYKGGDCKRGSTFRRNSSKGSGSVGIASTPGRNNKRNCSPPDPACLPAPAVESRLGADRVPLSFASYRLCGFSERRNHRVREARAPLCLHWAGAAVGAAGPVVWLVKTVIMLQPWHRVGNRGILAIGSKCARNRKGRVAKTIASRRMRKPVSSNAHFSPRNL